MCACLNIGHSLIIVVLILTLSIYTTLIIVTGTMGGARVKISVRCKIFQIEHKNCIYFTFQGHFSVFCGVFSQFSGVKFGIPKCCLCERNYKYQLCVEMYFLIFSGNRDDIK